MYKIYIIYCIKNNKINIKNNLKYLYTNLKISKIHRFILMSTKYRLPRLIYTVNLVKLKMIVEEKLSVDSFSSNCRYFHHLPLNRSKVAEGKTEPQVSFVQGEKKTQFS